MTQSLEDTKPLPADSGSNGNGGDSVRSSPWRVHARRLLRQRTTQVALAMVLLLVLGAVAAPWVAPYDPTAPDYQNVLAGPSPAHWAGTDSYGRDIFSRIIWGGRISLAVSALSVLLGGVIGIAIGLVSGYAGGRTDTLLMRACDVMLAFPGILLAIAVVALLGPGVSNVIYAVGVFSIPVYARVVRSATLGLRRSLYVQAARSIGVRPGVIIMRHIFPGALPAIIVTTSMRMGTAILVAAGLSFLGLGAQPPSPEWGAMLADGRSYLGMADHVAFFPGLAIFVTSLAFNVLGDGLRDALDQKLR
ncbi:MULTISPECIES: ABC transporter permease [unclassified Achromobacter]|uniref:ABC transporter permease n=1 Tax=unclassified Achromobacter TaxID=2626865 RepID=UPI000B517A4A|nr:MULTISPECIES: ABC transporter permease subunit [unclassified Achromobacter]OWT80215.1 glutathione ABC transporter permease [Achromobacter sp. HZ34]OWT82098.1 glutathione ABC transporter permease [Achromobacter sp. HZ28]